MPHFLPQLSFAPLAIRNNEPTAMGAKDRNHSNRDSECRRKGRSDPIEGLKVTMIVEEIKPGSALDMRLRQEQAKAVFDLLAATRPDAKDND